MPLSQTPGLHAAAHAFATIFVGFGINAIARPENALTFFEFSPPSATADREMVNALMAVCKQINEASSLDSTHDRLRWLKHVPDGVRDIFMGVAIYSAALFGTKKSLAWTLLAASGVAFADGGVCFSFGNGHWNHWGYAPIITVVGSLLLGVWDGTP